MRFGFVSFSIYVALVWCTFIVIWSFPEYVNYYIAFLVFLGLGLRPLLEWTGIYDRWIDLRERLDQKIHARHYREQRRKVAQAARDERYRKARKRDPRLPKHW